jgi:MtrB/PioB family decaheme-associated outer membrane protein
MKESQVHDREVLTTMWVPGTLIALLLPLAVDAQEPPETSQPDTSKWSCSMCPFADGWAVEAEAGVISVSDDSAKFGDYTGLEEEGEELLLDGEVRYWGDSCYRLEAEGENLGLDSKSARLGVAKQGLWEASLFYDEIPRRRFDDTATIFSGQGSSSLTLPDNWVRGGSTAQMPLLDDSLQGFDVEWDRETIGAGIGFLLGERFDFSADYRHEERDGNRLFAGTFYANGSILPAALDYNTDQFEASVGYTGDNWQVRLGSLLSYFNNKTWGQTWENPFTGTDVGRAGTSPDNQFTQYSLSGSYNFQAWRTVLSGNLSVGKGEQDDDYLPYTINPAIATDPLPRSNLDGELDTTNLLLRVTSSPWRRIRLKGEYRYDDRDNDSPVDTYNWVVVDSAPGGSTQNRIYSYTRDTVDLEASARLDENSRFYVGYRYDGWDRDDQERDETDTDRYWARFRFDAGSLVAFRATFGDESRSGSNYRQLVNDDFAPQNPLMRKYNMASRDRTDFEARFDIDPADAVDLGFSATYADEDYSNPSNVGLRKAEYLNYTVDGDYNWNDRANFYAVYSYEKYNSRQQGSQAFAEPDWSARSRDEFDTLILGIRMPQILRKVDLDVDYTYAQSEGQNRVSTAGLTSNYPELETERKTLRVTASYAFSNALSFKAGWIYEDYSSDDWAIDGIEPDTLPNLLTLGQDAYDYDVNVFMLSFKYSWETIRRDAIWPSE